MSNPAAPTSLLALEQFTFERILDEDPLTHSLILLGTFPNPQVSDGVVKAVVRIEKTALSPDDGSRYFGSNGVVRKVEVEGSTDIYTWLFGWLGEDRERDIKINIICPATDVHIRKYTKQEQVMVNETPAIYEQHVKPYILAFPPSRTQWVENILTGISEKSKILYSSSEFLLLPDMKWDSKTLSSLYLIALVQDRNIRSLRDLRRHHVDLLKTIQREAHRAVREKWGLGTGSLRMYVHYQPSYYHFHVHIVNVNYQGNILGMSIGQAHLLDDVISLLELDPETGPGIFERMTLTYGLGDQHGLYQVMVEANKAAVAA
ncbi:mRNA decapping enzyme [Pholiota conissans]|uniref:mRNA decapping enzyme n=1 Tax=Pholiota conissans TaxID=109636 RepID=A0A9P5Z1S4_9AGAR|nr:mRNA decapping enzyme [Pholiota conissans]